MVDGEEEQEKKCPACGEPVTDSGRSQRYTVDGEAVKMFTCENRDCRWNIVYGEASLSQ